MDTDIKSIAFAGGGSRCMWQTGFFYSLPNEFKKNLESCSAVSAGAFMACISFAEIAHESIEYFKKISLKNKKNFYPENLFKKESVFPQYKMYKKGISDLFDDNLLKKLKNGPSIKIVSASPPKNIPPSAAVLGGLLLYSVEKKLNTPLHPKWTKKVGFKPEITDLSDCETIDEMADTILQSSCTPPIMPILKKDNKPLLDGGLVDNVPAWVLNNEKGKKLILLSRKYPMPDFFEKEDRIYVQPSDDIEIKRWDYANPDGLVKAYNQGIEDGLKFSKNYLRK